MTDTTDPQIGDLLAREYAARKRMEANLLRQNLLRDPIPSQTAHTVPDTPKTGAALADAKTPEDFLKVVDAVKKEQVSEEEPKYTPEERKEIVVAQMAALESGEISPQFSLKVRDAEVAKGEIFVKSPEKQWTITVDETRLKEQTGIVLDAIADINVDPEFLFHRSRQLVRINFDERGYPLIEVITEPSLRGIIERSCDFVKKVRTKDDLIDVPVPPPKYVVQDVMSLPSWNTIKPLCGIVECPTILIDKRDRLSPKYCKGGRLITKQGYDSETQLFYAPPPGFIEPIIPDKPTEKNVESAVKLLKEIFENFPFIDEASKTNTLAALMTVVLRPMIDGAVPAFILNKNMPGTGASLISDSISMVATGKPASMITTPDTREEWMKTILATLMTGRTLACLDNIEGKLYSPKLASLLTSKTFEGRILGSTKMVSLPHTIVWVCNGINVKLGGDLGRRCYQGNMCATVARPWQRDAASFTHPNLLQWVSIHRSRILGAILTLARYWILNGSPQPGKDVPEMGGFEDWRNVIGGIVVFSGFKDFLGNLEQMYENSDVDTQQWGLFFERWYTKYGDSSKTVAEIIKDMKRSEEKAQTEITSIDPRYAITEPGDSISLVEVLPDTLFSDWGSGKKSFPRVLGNALGSKEGSIYVNGFQLVKGQLAHHAITWIVKQIDQDPKRGELGELAHEQKEGS